MNASATASRSTFVTVLGCVLVALGALSLIAAVLQNLMIGSALRDALAGAAPEQPGAIVVRLFRGVGLLNLAWAAFLTYAAYALLRGRNWARQTFVGLFAVGLIGNLAFLVLFGLFGLVFGSVDFPGPAQGQEQFAAHWGSVLSVFKAMFAAFAFFALAVTALLAWLIKRLRSQAVRAEFAGPAVASAVSGQ